MEKETCIYYRIQVCLTDTHPMLFAVWRSCHNWSITLCMCRASLTTQESCTLGLAACWLMVLQPVLLASLPRSLEWSLAT